MQLLSRWTSAGCPVEVEYSPRVLEDIREKAVSGLVALRRTGLGVGGLLLGTVSGNVVRILESEEIECSHAMGPGFALAPAELDALRARLQQKHPFTVVGMYLSKPRGDIDLTAQQLAIMQELFAEPSQVLLMIRPGSLEPSSAAFHYWTPRGLERGEEWDLLPWHPEIPGAASAEHSSRIAESVTSSKITAVAAGFAVDEDPPALPPVEPAAAFIAKQPGEEQPGAEEPGSPQPGFVPAPISIRFDENAAAAGADEPPGELLHPAERVFLGLRGNARKILTSCIAVLALLAISAAIYLSRPLWMTPPSANLTITDSGGILTFHWNPKAAEFVDAGTLSVLDGGHRTTVALTHDELMKGTRDYFRASNRVTASLALDERRFLASFAEPEKSARPVPAPAAVLSGAPHASSPQASSPQARRRPAASKRASKPENP